MATVAATLTAETGSLGVRGTTLERWPTARLPGSVEVDGLPVRVKVSPGRVKVEHDDAARVARARGRPLREVLARAEAAGLAQALGGEPAATAGDGRYDQPARVDRDHDPDHDHAPRWSAHRHDEGDPAS